MNEKSLVGFPLGTLKRMEMPRFMKGFVKSMTASRAKLMVMAPSAISALPSISSEVKELPTVNICHEKSSGTDCTEIVILRPHDYD